MCPLKIHLTKHQEFNGGRVMIGNNMTCRVVSIGNINLKMHDRSVYELKQARHVPNLKRNLISLGMMDQMGCIIKVQHGVVSIVKGSIVLLKEIRNNEL